MASFYGTGQNSEYDLGLGDATQRNDFTEITGDWLVIRSSGESYAKWSLGIKSDGTLWGVGDNSLKQLGGLASASYTTWTQIGTDTDWIDIALGAWHMIGLKISGVAWAVGKNSNGECGVGNTSTCASLTLVTGSNTFKSVHATQTRSAGVLSNDTLKTWGENGTNGYCGVGATTANYTSPQSVTLPATVAQISLGKNATHVILSDGKMYSWGYGGQGILGNGSTSNRTSPYQVGSDTNWQSVATGNAFACAIKTTGAAYSTGAGDYYATAQGSTSQIDTFTQIGSGTDWAECACGFYATLLRKTTGEIFAIGYNYTGVLGIGTGYDEVTALGDIEATYGATLPDGNRSISMYQAASYIAFTIAAEHASAPITITVSNLTESSSSPITVNVQGTESASAPIRVAVVDDLATSSWTAVVTLGWTDVSSRLTGKIQVDAEEGAARIADFTLLPTSGAVDPIAWTGSAVTIDTVRVINGEDVLTRVFTGIVDVATFNPTDGSVSFSCTDDLQNRVAKLSKDDIDLLAGGIYSNAVHGEIDEHWNYAQARMETRTASLDSGALGQLRVTEWNGLPELFNFTEAEILDKSLDVSLPRRVDIINRVDISYQYRYYKCRERHAWLAWSKSVLGTEGPASGYQYPYQTEIEGALSGCGWHRILEIYSPAPHRAIVPSPSGYYVEIPANTVSTCNAHLAQRHAQAITEEYTITVTAPSSITANGELSKPLRGALESDWNPNEWENDFSVTTPDATAGEVDYAGTNTRTVSDEAIQALLDTAKSAIYNSHRHTRVGFSVLCLPEIDLTCNASITTDAIEASGKVSRVQHTLDINAGEATTEITLTLSGVAAGGVITPTELVPPIPPTPDVGTDVWIGRAPNLLTHIGNISSYTYQESDTGYLCSAPETYTATNGTDSATITNTYYSSNPLYAQGANGFRIKMPGVLDNYRNPATVNSDNSYQIEIPTDAITLTV